MDIQSGNIMALEKSYRAQRQATHEFQHHLQTISNLLDATHNENAREYIDNLLVTQTERIFCVQSGHPILDALLNQKYQVARESNIDMQFQVNDLSKVSVPNEMLVVLLSNLLDNAIEATKALDNKRIELLFAMQNSNRIIICKNTIAESVLKTNKELASTKPNRDRHGLGHLIMEKIVKNYNGFVDYFEEDGMFGVEIILPLPEEENR